MGIFRVSTDFEPRGDQPAAIRSLVEGCRAGAPHQVLLGVTGSGKTFTIAKVIESLDRPVLVIAHNKTLAAQLYGEFRELFPENAVEFFVSYYDYYQPEAYLPTTDTFIEKDAMVNDDIDRLRHSATRAVLERRDVIVVASVSCIYGIGSPQDYMAMHLVIEEGMHAKRDALLRRMVDMQYQRTDAEFKRGRVRVRGDVLEVFPSFSVDRAIRIEFFGDDVDRLVEFDARTGTTTRALSSFALFPNTHWITPKEKIDGAISAIIGEMKERVEYFNTMGRAVEAQRIEQRTLFDVEMLREFGYCHGIENYTRHLSGRMPGAPPSTLIDYFPEDFLTVIDESHATVPQIGGMYEGDRSRKSTLIDFGFRLPSALDNRPLQFHEFQSRVRQAVYVSATPAVYEREKAGGRIVEQIIRPTGLIDPEMVIRPVSGQVDNLLGEIRLRAAVGERVLITTLTKKMAEDLTNYYTTLGVRAQYLHSDIDTMERVKIIRDLRLGEFDVLVGVNLLREGLDLPEVSLVAIFDADKEGFLRSERSLIQTAGRAARNINGKVILYADVITGSMQRAMDETERRRAIQLRYNRENKITPETVRSHIKDILGSIYEADYPGIPLAARQEPAYYGEDAASIDALEAEMREAARVLDFERATILRDRLRAIKEKGPSAPPAPVKPRKASKRA